MKENKVKYLIIGAGITGLSFARKAKEDYLILEKEKTIGGYCRTIKKDGFIWDYSGHFYHFKDEKVKKDFIKKIKMENLVFQKKNTKVLYKGKKINYPFQMNIHQLPKKEFIECLYDLYNKKEEDKYKNFLEMLYGKFGKAIVDKFLKPYNEKLYACNLQLLDQNAMGRFFPYANIGEIINNMKENTDKSYNSEFLYPKSGAQSYINAIYEELDKNKIILNTAIIKVNEQENYIETINGEKIYYEYLINTIPFNNFLKLFENIYYHTFSDKLSYNQVLVLNLGFNKNSKHKEHWMYIPDKDINFYRIGFYNNILLKDKLSMYVEIGFPKNVEIDVKKELELTLENLKKLKIIDNHKLESYESIIMNPAYVHINEEHNRKLDEIKKQMKKVNIYSIGRYGGWKYCSMEDCMLEAYALFNEIGKEVIKNES